MPYRRLLPTILCCLSVVLAACEASAAPSANPNGMPPTPGVLSGDAKVVIQLQSFVPRSLTVRRGTTVTWTNQDLAGHTVHADGGLFRSPLLANRQSFSFTFDIPGVYPYYCDQHGGPGGAGMSGVVDVVP
jgi:plastocyanin